MLRRVLKPRRGASIIEALLLVAVLGALSEQIGLRRSRVVRSLSGCKIPSVISTVRPR